jgi:hypothetical protein
VAQRPDAAYRELVQVIRAALAAAADGLPD